MSRKPHTTKKTIEAADKGVILKGLSARALREEERLAEDACTQKQVSFVRAVVFEGASQTEAYQRAGYAAERPTHQIGKLVKRPEVMQLFSVYNEVMRRQALMTGESLQLATIEILDQAMEHKDRNTALRAIDQLAKLGGVYKNDSNVTIKDERSTVPQMDQATLKELFAAKRLKGV